MLLVGQYDLPLWAKLALAALVAGILIYDFVVGKRCPKCRHKMEEIRVKDPLAWRFLRVLRVPRQRTVTYRCPECATEETARELTDGNY